MAKTSVHSGRAKAEARPAETASKQIEASMDQMAGFASKFSEYAESSMRAMADSAVASGEMMRELGTRNVNFMTNALEQSTEFAQSLANVRDPRELFDMQANFARTMMSAYASEVSAQTEICLGAWRDAAKPFMARISK